MAAEVRLLRPDDDRSGFRSGNADFDRFLSRYAGQNQFRHHVGITYVAVVGGGIVGFVTVAASQVEVADLPEADRRRLPRYPLPVLRLARLAVDENAQGRGIGKVLLRAVFALAQEMARTVGCVGVLVDAKPDAVGFYERLGFREMATRIGALGDRPEPLPMYLHLSAILNHPAS
ncbi:MAG: GNAT family N-acetyltransferase [Oligoflexia bacterium]|nr:GNAT family N-acetyltransferase [Oligoflexia bacterium]